MWQKALRSGTGFEMEFRARAADGSYRWVQTRGTPARDAAGKVTSWVNIAVDIDDLRKLQDRQTVLVAELQHRVRNTLTVVRSVFQRTAETTPDAADVADHFKGRLDAMARTQVLATHNAARLVDLESLIRDELLSVGVHDGPETSICGPDVALPFDVAEPVALAIHELTTNALKYGALRTSGAELDIRWEVNLNHGGQRQLDLCWAESGVPAVSVSPARKGFGRELIEEALPYRLGAKADLKFAGNGVRCSISIPLPGEGDEASLLKRIGWW
ncbi:MAG TPA: HWE histidine kinase domain-containing protein [Qipengyuania sp.]|nr:HWE histidine kinase domain-containing protein [Qipengyuania sp.]